MFGNIKRKIKNLVNKLPYYPDKEIVLVSSKMIQAQYDYGCKPNEYKIYVYRITVTNPDGKVIELDDIQIKEFCDKNGLLYSDTFLYYGTVKDLYDKLNYGIKYGVDFEGEWRDNFLELLMIKYTEKNCYMCINKVPEEGIIIRKQSLYDYNAFKLKSFRFFELESKQLDDKEVDIESEQSITE